MIWIDYSIIGLISISLIIGLFRGLIREAFALLTWVVASWVAFTFSPPVATLLVDIISIESIRIATASISLFILTLLVGAIINYLLRALVKKSGPTGTDRFAGLIFGIVRGSFIIIVVVMLAGLTPIPNQPWWKKSQLLPHFQSAAIWLRSHIPNNLTNSVNY
jgi:membrane protein required for colicin V production